MKWTILMTVFCFAATNPVVAAAGGENDACWIAYPGDYGIWRGNELQSQRLQWGARLTPFWPMYEAHTRVLFRKFFSLEEEEEIEVRADGHYTLGFWDDQWHYCETTAIDGKLVLPKGTKGIIMKVQNSTRPPAIWIKGKTVKTDGDWNATWASWEDKETAFNCDTFRSLTNPDIPPGLAKLPRFEKKPLWCKSYKGNHLIADFGEETYGYLRLMDIRGNGQVKIIYAESEAEMYAEELADRVDGALDGWEQIKLSEAKEYCRKIAHGFRYVHIIPVAGDVTVGSVKMDYETKGMPVKGSFRCNDEEINRIWDVAVHTLELTCREVFIEGVKRDHWVWSGDAVQSFLMNYYVYGDYEGCRDTIWTLRGKDPVKMHLNSIMDYTFYWFDAVEKYRLFSGDKQISKQIYPRMKSLMQFAINRLDENGRPANRPGDWMFIDWAPEKLNNEGGVVSFEQMLLVRALEATAKIAAEAGETDDAATYRERAAKLRSEIVPLWWDEKRGALMHLLKDDGTLDGQLTRYPNMFGLFYGYFNDAQRESVIKNVIFNDKVMKIQTPYMRFYELEALCALGRQTDVTKEIKNYWGGMLKLGATSFWELYNPSESDLAHYAMYGRRFGKSLCHAWGASPVYLLGRYYLGVTPTSPGFDTYDVKPNLGGLEWIEGDVPTPWGRIHVYADRNGHKVTEIR